MINAQLEFSEYISLLHYTLCRSFKLCSYAECLVYVQVYWYCGDILLGIHKEGIWGYNPALFVLQVKFKFEIL